MMERIESIATSISDISRSDYDEDWDMDAGSEILWSSKSKTRDTVGDEMPVPGADLGSDILVTPPGTRRMASAQKRGLDSADVAAGSERAGGQAKRRYSPTPRLFQSKGMYPDETVSPTDDDDAGGEMAALKAGQAEGRRRRALPDVSARARFLGQSPAAVFGEAAVSAAVMTGTVSETGPGTLAASAWPAISFPNLSTVNQPGDRQCRVGMVEGISGGELFSPRRRKRRGVVAPDGGRYVRHGLADQVSGWVVQEWESRSWASMAFGGGGNSGGRGVRPGRSRAAGGIDILAVGGGGGGRRPEEVLTLAVGVKNGDQAGVEDGTVSETVTSDPVRLCLVRPMGGIAAGARVRIDGPSWDFCLAGQAWSVVPRVAVVDAGPGGR